jgi:hypothetical protein
MSDPLSNERVSALLREAEDASRLLERLAETGGDPREVREALEGIWRDLGRQVHQAWRAALVAPADAPPTPGPAPVRREPTPHADDFAFEPGPDDRTDVPEVTAPPEGEAGDGEDLERWYTDEIEIESVSGTLFRPGELGAEHLPESAAEVGTLVAAPESEPAGFPEGGVGQGPEAPWLGALRELLDTLGPPPSGDPDAGALAEEASRVQWATTNIEVAWADFPAPVRVSLSGLLAARARFLQERLEVDVGPRLALDRLRKYARVAGIAPVVGVLPERSPESGAWADDAARWYAVLVEALQG